MGHECAAQPLGDVQRLPLPVEVFAEDYELVAAEAGHAVARSYGIAQPRCDECQQFIAGGVAQAVVDPLKAVEVEEQHGRQRSSAAAAGQRLAEAVQEERTVGETGQRVVEGLVEHGFFDGLALGDVADVEDDPLDGRVFEQVAHDELDPAPRSVGVTGPVLDGRDRVAAGDGGLPRGHGERDVVGVDEPPPCLTEELFGLVAEHPLDRRADVAETCLAVTQQGDVRRVLDEGDRVARKGRRSRGRGTGRDGRAA